MDPGFWHQRWQTNETGWHEKAANPLLLKHFPSLSLPNASRLFVPLCGKSLDVGWLLAQGYHVAGAELSELAVTQLFAQLGMEPIISEIGLLKHYRGTKLDVFVGDIFQLTHEVLSSIGKINAVYDRAALVALPPDMRIRYTAHLQAITATAPQLLICYEYDQTVVPGPPFSVPAEEVHRHYDTRYRLTLLESLDVAGGLKGKCPSKEHVWLLKPREK